MTVAVALMPAAFGYAQPGAQAAPEAQAQPQIAVIPTDDQPSKEQLDRLFEVMQLRKQMAAIIKTLPTMMQQQISQQIKTLAAGSSGAALTPDQQAAVDKLMKKYMEKALSLYPADEMINDLSSIYQRHLSKEDVETVIAFYSSPAGQHMLELSPAVMKEYMPLVMSRMQERSKALTEEMKKDLQEPLPASTPGANGPAPK
jgi:hypothetical protein